MKNMIEQAGSIGDYFLRFYDKQAEDLTSCLVGFTSSILSMDYSAVYGSKGIPPDSYFPFFFLHRRLAVPASGSACFYAGW